MSFVLNCFHRSDSTNLAQFEFLKYHLGTSKMRRNKLALTHHIVDKLLSMSRFFSKLNVS